MIIMFAGLLPFGSIFIETYFVFTSFWAPNKTYYVYGFMLLVFIILLTVTACVSIVSTCTFIHAYLFINGVLDFLLNSEDHRWHWTSFFAAGSTAGYVFLYAMYYFFARYAPRALIFAQDKDVWAVPDGVVLWLHGHCLFRHVSHAGMCRASGCV